jgi:ABC-type uncharacterized transport system substrate-binding protein
VIVRQKFFWLLPVLLFASVHSAEAQQPGKVFRIGYLEPGTASSNTVLLDGFRQELTKLGWIEGKNIAIEYRFAEQKNERLPELAAELVRLQVDLIVVSSTPPALVAKKATTSIPIVIANAGDPVGTGLVESLSRPGGNVTGLASLSTELITKRLEILKDAVPKLARVGFFREPASSASPQAKELRRASSALKVKLEEIETQVDAKGFESAFQTAMERQVNGFMTIASRNFLAGRRRIVELACLRFTSRRSLSMRAVLCPTGQTTMTCSAKRPLRGQDLERREAG